MARPGRPERNRAARSFRQLSRFHHVINSDKVFGTHSYWISRGVDNREVRADRIRKSVGAESTFVLDLTDFEAMVSELQPLVDKVWRHCEDKGMRGKTVTLKVKFADFEIMTRSRS